MPRRGNNDTNLLVQGWADAKLLAKLVKYYKKRGESIKIRTMSALIRAVIEDLAAITGGEDILHYGDAVEILQNEKLMPLSERAQKRIINAEIHQARIEQQAEGYPITKMVPKKHIDAADQYLNRSSNDEKLEDIINREHAGIERLLREKPIEIKSVKETFTERQRRLREEADRNRESVIIEPVDIEKE